MSIKEKNKKENEKEDFYTKQLNAIVKFNRNELNEKKFKQRIGKGTYNVVFKDDDNKFVMFVPLICQNAKKEKHNRFNKALANALLSAGGRHTLKYGIYNGIVYTKLKEGDIVGAYNEDSDKYNDITTAIEYGQSAGDKEPRLKKRIYDNSTLLYPLPQLLLFGMLDRKPDNTLFKYSKIGKIKLYEADNDDLIFLGHDGNHLFNNDKFWRKQTILVYLNELKKQNDTDPWFKDKIADCIKKFTLTEDKMKYVIKYTATQAYYLELDNEEVKSFLQQDLERYFKYLEYLKNYDWHSLTPFMKEEIKKFCEENQKIIFGLSKDDCDKIIDDVFEEQAKNKDMKEKRIKEIKQKIAKIVNSKLGKTYQKKQKKLFWERSGEGCKNGQLLNTRFFLKENAGYICEINNYYDKMCEQGKQNDIGELNNLLNLAKNAYYRPISACY